MPRRHPSILRRVLDLADAQAGLATAAQLSMLGIPPSTTYYRTRPGGMWSRVLPGVHLLSGGTPSRIQREVASLLYCGDRAMLTGLTALRHHGMPLPEGDQVEFVHVLVPHETRRAQAAFVRLVRTRHLPQPARPTGQPLTPVAPPERALIDAALLMRSGADVTAMVSECLRRKIADLDGLEYQLTIAPRQGSALIRQAIGHARAGTWSAPEAELRTLLATTSLPEPLWNRRLRGPNGSVIAVPDAWFDDVALAVEVDSQEFHSSGSGWERTLERQARYARFGVVCIPITPRQIRMDPGGTTRAIEEAYVAASRRPRPLVHIDPATAPPISPTSRAPWGG